MGKLLCQDTLSTDQDTEADWLIAEAAHSGQLYGGLPIAVAETSVNEVKSCSSKGFTKSRRSLLYSFQCSWGWRFFGCREECLVRSPAKLLQTVLQYRCCHAGIPKLDALVLLANHSTLLV